MSPDIIYAQQQAEEDRKLAKQFLMEAKATLESAREVARMAFVIVHESAESVREIKAVTEAHARQSQRESQSFIEEARRRRQEEDLEQKSKIDDLYLRTRQAAMTIKERAEAEFKIQETLRERYMKETDDMLAKGREELEHVVRNSEQVVRRAEDRLNTAKADSHAAQLCALRVKADMQACVKEAQEASSTAWSEVNYIKNGLHDECRKPVDDLLRTLSAAHMLLNEMQAEQSDLMHTKSRGLELEAQSAVRHAVQKNELRKHLVKWTLDVSRLLQSNLPICYN